MACLSPPLCGACGPVHSHTSAFLPSTFSMYATMLVFAAWLEGNHLQSVRGVCVVVPGGVRGRQCVRRRAVLHSLLSGRVLHQCLCNVVVVRARW